MQMRNLAMGAALLLSTACGGSSSEPADDETAGGEEHGHHGAGHHDSEQGEHGEGEHAHRMSEGLSAFHDVLATPYHMDPGEERAVATCGAAARMAELSAGVDQELEQPDMSAATAQLIERCAAEGNRTAAVEEQLESLHDVFHAAMQRWRDANPE